MTIAFHVFWCLWSLERVGCRDTFQPIPPFPVYSSGNLYDFNVKPVK